MANVEPAAPVIDLEVLLKPISEEKPSGELMQYSGLYDEIREARRADDTLNQGEWQTDVKVANYRQVVDLAVPALTSQTKDLQICAWLSEALTKQHGFTGLRDALQLVRGIEETFWETCYPEIDEGDMEGRANAIEWLDTQVSVAVKTLSLTSPGNPMSFLDWDESTRFDIPEDLDSRTYEEKEKFKVIALQAEQEKRKTGEMWRSAKAVTNRAFYELLNLTLEECWTEVNALDRVDEEKFDRNQVPAVRNLKKSLEDIRGQVSKILEEKRIAEPDPIEEIIEETVNEDGEVVVVTKGQGASTGAIQNRQDAIKRLGEIADYFRRTEPHSPLSYLVQRAVKWGSMPLEVWLQDVIKDDNVVSQIRQTLGFNTGSPDENPPS